MGLTTSSLMCQISASAGAGPIAPASKQDTSAVFVLCSCLADSWSHLFQTKDLYVLLQSGSSDVDMAAEATKHLPCQLAQPAG